MSDKQSFGELDVYLATHGWRARGKRKLLAEDDRFAVIDDGRFGEFYLGDAKGARRLAANLMDAADAYDALIADGAKHCE